MLRRLFCLDHFASVSFFLSPTLFLLSTPFMAKRDLPPLSLPRLSLSNTCSSLLTWVGWGNAVPGPNESWPWDSLASTTMTSRYISSSKWTLFYPQSSNLSARCLSTGLMITQSWNMLCCMLSWRKGLADSLHHPLPSFPLDCDFALRLFYWFLSPSPAWFNIKMHLWDTWIIKQYSTYLLP